MLKTLIPDEKILADARFHPFYTVCAFFFFFSLFGIGIMAGYVIRHFMGITTLMPGLLGLGVGGLILLQMLIRQMTTEIILTERRLLYKKGLLSINVAEVDVEQLASDDVRQTLFGRLLDYGAIHIRCIEASDIYLPPVMKPYEFRNALEAVKKEYREKYMSVERLRHHGMNPGDT
jgi:hypothetical protein